MNVLLIAAVMFQQSASPFASVHAKKVDTAKAALDTANAALSCDLLRKKCTVGPIVVACNKPTATAKETQACVKKMLLAKKDSTKKGK